MRAPRFRDRSRCAALVAARALRGARAALAGVLILAGLAPACTRARDRDAAEVERGLVALHTARMNLRHDRIGDGKWATDATFVLLDAENTHREDLMVTLSGELLDAGGRVVGALRPASLRVPAGGVRTFALVDREQKARPQATTARVEVAGAHVPAYAPPVVITDGHVHRDGDRVVVTGMVRNTAEQGVRVLVLGGFHDAAGVPLTRPFVEMYLAGNASHPLELVGPPGSVSGYAFIGDLAY